MNIWDLLTNEKVLIAFASALGAVLGGLFSFIGNFFLKKLEFKEARKKTLAEYNKELLKKFDVLSDYLANYKKIVREKDFSATNKMAYDQIKFGDIRNIASELGLKYNRNWSRNFRFLDSRIRLAFENAEMDGDIVDSVDKLETELEHFRALQSNNLTSGRLRLYYWKVRGTRKFKDNKNLLNP